MAKQSRSQYLSGAAAKRAAKQLAVLAGAVSKIATAKTDKARSNAVDHAVSKIDAIAAELGKIETLSTEQE